MVSSGILVGCLTASRYVGWAQEDLPIIRRALPSGLALGVVVARTATNLFDYVTSEIRERLYIASAKRAIFQPDHADVFIDVQEKFTEAWHTEEERALNEAAKEARSAVERTIRRKSALQEEARRQRANKRVLQVAHASLTCTVAACAVPRSPAPCCHRRHPLPPLSAASAAASAAFGSLCAPRSPS
jgi:hypothetical protein